LIKSQAYHRGIKMTPCVAIFGSKARMGFVLSTHKVFSQMRCCKLENVLKKFLLLHLQSKRVVITIIMLQPFRITLVWMWNKRLRLLEENV